MRFSVTILAGLLAGAFATPLPSVSNVGNDCVALPRMITWHNRAHQGSWRFNQTSSGLGNKRPLGGRDLAQRTVPDLNVTRKVILKPTPRAPNLLKRKAKDEVEAIESNNTAVAETKSDLPKPGVVLLELIMNFTLPEQNATSKEIGVKLDITQNSDDAKDVKKEEKEESTTKAKGKAKGAATDDDDDDDDEQYKKAKGDGDDDDDDDDDDKHKEETKELKKEAEDLKKEGDAAKEDTDKDTDDAKKAKSKAKGTKYAAQKNKKKSGKSKAQTKVATKDIKEDIKDREGGSKWLVHKRSVNETDESHKHRHEVNREEFMRFVESVDRAEDPPNRVNP